MKIAKKGGFPKIFVFLIILFLISLTTAQDYSVDAIAVYEKEGAIYYSFYGHDPAIPKPIDAPLTWKWWSLGAGNTAILAEPPPTLPPDNPPTYRHPKVAFSREGYAIAVWSTFDEAGTVDCGGGPIPRYKGDIMYSVFNGTNWGPNKTLAESAVDNIYLYPSIAIDNNGYGLVVWTHRLIEDPCGGPEVKIGIRSKEWNGSDWINEKEIRPITLFGYRVEEPQTTIAFTSELVEGKTRQKAVAAWYHFKEKKTVICDDEDEEIWMYWPEYSVWNGTGFGAVKDVPGRRGPPRYESQYPASIDQLGISPTQYQTGELVFAVITQEIFPNLIKPGHHICNPHEHEVWSSYFNSTDFLTASNFSKGINPSIAHTSDNNGYATYSKESNVEWTLFNGSDRIPKGQWDIAIGFKSRIASLHRNRTMVLYVQGNEIKWSFLDHSTEMMNNGVFLDNGERPFVAAHTGSPTLPHAEWSYAGFFDGDNDLHEYITGNLPGGTSDRTETLQIGSTNLVNTILMSDPSRFATFSGPAPFPDGNTRYEYVKLGSATEIKKLADLDSGDQSTLEDFIAFAVEAYPARRFVLDFGDHGDGWKGHCLEINSAYTITSKLNMTETKGALTNAGKKFNLLVFSECLMAQLEVAYQFKDFANFMVASEELMPGNGANYVRILTNFTLKPFQQDADFARNMVNFFTLDYAGGVNASSLETLSAIKLSAINALVTSVNNFADVIRNQNLSNTSNVDFIKEKRNLTEEFPHLGYTNGSFGRYPREGYRDLKHFAQLMLSSPNATIVAAAQDVINKVDAAVIAEWHDTGLPGHPNATGLSIWFERNGIILSNLLPSYNATDFAQTTSWDEFLQNQTDSSGILFILNAPSSVILST